MERERLYKGIVIGSTLVAGASLLITFGTLGRFAKDPYQSDKLIQKHNDLSYKMKMLNEEKSELPKFICENDYNPQLKKAFDREYEKAKTLDDSIESLELKKKEIESDSLYIKTKKRHDKLLKIAGVSMGTFAMFLGLAAVYEIKRTREE